MHALLILLIALLVAAASVGLLIAGVTAARMSATRRRNVTFRRRIVPAVNEIVAEPGGTIVVRLDVDPSGRRGPALDRLVEEAAAAAFRVHPDAVSVEVRSPGGTALGRKSRSVAPAHPRRGSGGPGALTARSREPRAPRSRVPDVSRHLTEEPLTAPPSRGPMRPNDGGVQPAVRRPLSAQFELPGAVTERLGDPDDAVGLIEAILRAGGADVIRDADMLRTGDLAVVVLPHGDAVWVSRRDLNHAFLRIQSSDAARGLVVAFGHLDPEEVRTRESIAPAILHVGPRDIQRMADAVAVGADPVRFAAGTGARG